MLDVVMIRASASILWNSTVPPPSGRRFGFIVLWICRKATSRSSAPKFGASIDSATRGT